MATSPFPLCLGFVTSDGDGARVEIPLVVGKVVDYNIASSELGIRVVCTEIHSRTILRLAA